MKIGIIGCGGRMGQMLVREVLRHDDCELAGGVEHAKSDYLGKDVAAVAGLDPAGLKITSDCAALLSLSDAVIDFTTPDNTLSVAALAAKQRKVHVIGTTGLNDAQKKQLSSYTMETAIIMAPNMSLGVNFLEKMVEYAASKLNGEFDIEVIEMHHRHKVDAPSGTALALGEAAARGRKVALADVARYERYGKTGARPEGEIGFSVLRGGDVIGDHTVMFAADGERIELTHKASDRSIYARGAVRAALWAQSKKPGFYNIKDVLDL